MNKSQILGRSSEYIVSSMLLDAQREVYLPAVDDHGVDLIVRTKNHTKGDGSKPEHYEFQEIQIKSASDNGLFVFACAPRPNYWFVFYVKSIKQFWLINSLDVHTIASINTKGKNVGKHTLNLSPSRTRKIKLPQFTINDFTKLP